MAKGFVEMKIPLEQAREEVRARLFGSKCAAPTQEQWDLIIDVRFQNPERFPNELRKKLERALLVREIMDQQLSKADKWLRQNGFDYPVVVIRQNFAATIEPVAFDANALQQALQKEFGDPADRPLSAADVGKLLVQYLKTTNGKPSQDAAIKYVEASEPGRKFNRDSARAAYKKLAPNPVARGRPRSA
jgi:hypothetical protein